MHLFEPYLFSFIFFRLSWHLFLVLLQSQSTDYIEEQIVLFIYNININHFDSLLNSEFTKDCHKFKFFFVWIYLSFQNQYTFFFFKLK